MITPTLCIHHAPCADGFAAAWTVRERFGEGVKFHPGVYGQPPPDVTGEDVLLVDFSYKAGTLIQMAAKARSVTVLDHHMTAQRDLLPLLDRGMVDGQFDMERSGAMLTWDWCFPDTPPPTLFHHIQDRDLWRFRLPHTREIQANLFSYPYEFVIWDDIIRNTEDPLTRQRYIGEGAAILRMHDKTIDELLKYAKRDMVIGGVRVPVANLPYTMASDAAGKMAEAKDIPFAATYIDLDGQRVFSLRSRGDGMNVAEIALKYDGGGHMNSAGFQRPLGWEGDVPLDEPSSVN